MAVRAAPPAAPGIPEPRASPTLVNELGNWLGEIALAILVYDQTGSPMATAALFFGMHFAPALLGPPLVARLEAAPARRRAAGPLRGRGGWRLRSSPCSPTSFSLVVVLALATFDGSIASAARALTRAAASAVLAPAGQLREGNALLNVAFTVGAAGGPAIAGLVVAGAGVETALLADAASFLAVAVLLVVARAAAEPPPTPTSPRPTGRERLRSGLAYVRERPALRRLLGAQALAFIFFSLVIPIEVVFAKETLDAGDAGYGALLAELGRRHGRSAASPSPRCGESPLRALLFFSTAGDRRRLPRHRGLARPCSSPAPPRCSAGSATASSGSRSSPPSRS